MTDLINIVCNKCEIDFPLPIEEAKKFNKRNKFVCNECSTPKPKKSSIDIINDKDKKVFFIIGMAGSGKTTLANVLKHEIVINKNISNDDIVVYDDVSYKINRNLDIEIIETIASIRHTDKNVLVLLHTLPHYRFNFLENKYITWIFTSMSKELYQDLCMMFGLSPTILKNFYESNKNIWNGSEKRAYLMITKGKYDEIIYKINSYKKPRTMRDNG